MEERLVELELRYTEQQALLQALSDVIYTQARALDSLQAQVNLLQRRLEEEPGIVDARTDEPPPHY